MLKYKDTYFIIKNKDSQGNVVNKDDNYIKCKKAQIYRYNDDILAIQFYTTGYANNRLKELSSIGVQLTILQSGDDEQVYTFSESYLPQLSEIVKAKKRIKKDLTDEQREVLRLRIQNLHNKNDIKTV